MPFLRVFETFWPKFCVLFARPPVLPQFQFKLEVTNSINVGFVCPIKLIVLWACALHMMIFLTSIFVVNCCVITITAYRKLFELKNNFETCSATFSKNLKLLPRGEKDMSVLICSGFKGGRDVLFFGQNQQKRASNDPNSLHTSLTPPWENPKTAPFLN